MKIPKQKVVINDKPIIIGNGKCKSKGGSLSLKKTIPIPVALTEVIVKEDVRQKLPKKKFKKVKKIDTLLDILKKREKKDVNKDALNAIKEVKKDKTLEKDVAEVLLKEINDIAEEAYNNETATHNDLIKYQDEAFKKLNMLKQLKGESAIDPDNSPAIKIIYEKLEASGIKIFNYKTSSTPSSKPSTPKSEISDEFFEGENEIITEVKEEEIPEPIATLEIPTSSTPPKRSRGRPPKIKIKKPSTGSGIELETLDNKKKEVIYLILKRMETIQLMPKKYKTDDIIKEYENLKKELETLLKAKWHFDINGKYITGTGCFNCMLDEFEMDDDEYINGSGFRKFLKNVGKKLFGLRPSVKNPPKLNDALSSYGDEAVSQLKIVRTPISSVLSTLVNIVSLGALKKEMDDKGHDAFYHLQLLINNKYSLEKVEVVSLSVCKSCVKPNSQVMLINESDIPSGLTIKQMIDNTRTEMGDLKFTGYNALTNNCQDFINAVLKANKINNSKYSNFIKQDTTQLIKNTPVFAQKFMKASTNVGAFVSRITQGGSTAPKRCRGRPKKI